MMTEDIHKWTDGRYTLMFDEHTFFIFDNEKEKEMTVLETTKKLNKQQDIISQLKQENEKLKNQLNKRNTMNIQLREINKKIGDDLYNCRLNKNITSKALKLWQETLAEYDIYTINDLEESFELDAKINKEKNEKIKELEVKVLNLELKNEELVKNDNR